MYDVSKRSQLGLYVMVALTREPKKQRSNEELARMLNASTNHLAKVLQTLARAGWISSTRGAGGGYVLACNPTLISMADVVELFEGPTQLKRCSLTKPQSPCEDWIGCEIGSVMQEINEQAYYTLKSINLYLLAHPPGKNPQRVSA